MKKRWSWCLLILFWIPLTGNGQLPAAFSSGDASYTEYALCRQKLLYASAFLDAAINSSNALTGLVRKEAYRNKVSSFNNPVSSELGFNLENEVQTALKPLLRKAKHTDASRFSGIVSGFFDMQKRSVAGQSLQVLQPVFPSIMGLVSNLALHEKRITREDLDSFMLHTSRYFLQFEKLNLANHEFEKELGVLDRNVASLQQDIRDYLVDLVQVLYRGQPEVQWHRKQAEEIFLQYFQELRLAGVFARLDSTDFYMTFPADGIKKAKEINSGLQKLSVLYRQIYSSNYAQVRSILAETKQWGATIDQAQLDRSLKELDTLYRQSLESDAVSLRFATLAERLQTLTAAEQLRVLR